MKKQTHPPQPCFKEAVALAALLLCFVSTSLRAYAWEFEKAATADVTAPTIVSLSPVNGATNVSVDVNLIATFSEPIVAIAGGVVEIKRVSGGILFESFTLPHANVSISGNTVTINPTNSLLHSTEYFVNFVTAIEDFEGNDFADPLPWFIETRANDYVAPTVLTLSPANSTTNFGIGGWPVITFSEHVTAVAGKTISILRKADDAVIETFTLPTSQVVVSASVVTIKPTVALENSTEYYITMEASAFTDLSTNEFAGISNNTTWYFKTAAALISLSPINGASDADPNGNLIATFSENISLGAGTIFINNFSNATTVETITLPDARVTVSGAAITINPTATLPLNVLLYVVIQNGVIKDADGEDIGQIGGSTQWAFYAQEAVTSIPTVSSFSPSNNATAVSITVDPTLTFSENIGTVSGGAVNLKRYSDDAVIKSIPVSNSSPTTNTYSLGAVSGGLSYNTKYYITISHDAFKNADDTFFPGIGSKDTWSFTTELDPNAETVAPSITSYFPSVGATEVDRATGMELQFSENVSTVAGKEINIYRYADDVFVKKFILSSGTLNSSYNITSQVEPNLEGSTQYYVLVESGAFKDLWENEFAGISDKDSWKFTTEVADVTSPTVVSTTPSNGAIDVAVDIAEIIVDFNELVYEGTSSDLTITGFGTLEVGAVASLENGNLYIYPPSALAAGTTITITLAAGLLQDNDGNPTEEFSFSFTTAAAPDTEAPSIVSLSPADNATDISLTSNLVLTFNENIVAGSGTIAIRKVSDNSLVQSAAINSSMISTNTLTFDPFDFDAETEYYVDLSVGSVQDAAGNPSAGLSGNPDWTFTTIAPDVTAPTVSSFSPANNAIDVALDASLVITFDESVQLAAGGAGKVATIRTIEENFAEFIFLEDANITTISGNTVTMNFDGLENGRTYYIKIESNVLADISGNVFDGFTTNDVWRFTTVAAPDTEAPFIVSLSPEDNATDVSLITDLVITFNEPVIASAGSIVVKKLSDNSTLSTTSITNAAVSGNTVTVEDVSLEAGTEYYIDLPAELVRDAAGNYSAGQTGNPNWTFTTLAPDVTAPQVVVFVPENSSTTVPVNQRIFKAKFDEPFSRNDAAIYLREYDTDRLVTGNNIFSISTQSGDTLIIDIDWANTLRGLTLASGTRYYFDIASHGIKDAANNTRGFAKGEWEFTTAGTPGTHGPLLQHQLPANNATDVAVDTWMYRAYFDRAVIRQSALVYLKNYSTDDIVAQMNLGNNVILNDTLLINFNQFGALDAVTLDFGTKYYIDIPSGVLKDDFGYENVTQGKDAWTFTTENAVDTTAPYIVSVEPADDATNVSVNTTFTITYSEPVMPNEAGNPFVRLMIFPNQVEQVQLNNTAQVTIDGSVITISFSEPLQYSTTYLLGTFNGMVKDAAGNVNEENPNFQFTTEAEPDITPPSIVSLSPATMSTDVAVNSSLVITFNEPIQKGTGTAQIQFYTSQELVATWQIEDENVLVSGNTLTLQLLESLPANTRMYASIFEGAVTDLAGNVYLRENAVTEKNWEFTTSDPDTQAPEVVSFSPANNATGVALNATLSVTFNESIKLAGNGATKAFIIRTVENDVSELVLIDNNDINGNTVSVSFPQLAYGRTYYLTLETDVLTDISNNVFTGFSASDVWRFTTEDAPKQEQSIFFNELTPKTFGDAAFEISASATSNLVVFFASSDETVATVNGNLVTLVGAGSANITATQGGDATFNAASPVVRELVVNKADQTLVFGSLQAVNVSDPPFALAASASSGLDVSYTSSDVNVATVLGNTITLVGAGTTMITASQPGNSNYNAATSVEQELIVNALTATIALSGSLDFGNILQGETEEKTLTITNEGEATLQITSIEVPAGFTASVTTASVNANSSVTVTITFAPTELKTYSGVVSVTSNAMSGTNEIAVSGTGTTITGFNEPHQPAGSLDVFPNPGTGLYTVKGRMRLRNSVSITDLSGKSQQRMLSSFDEENHQLDITDLPQGVYYLKVEENGSVAVKRIVKLN